MLPASSSASGSASTSYSELSDPGRVVNMDALAFPQNWVPVSFHQTHGGGGPGSTLENTTIEHLNGSDGLLSPLPSSSSFFSSHGHSQSSKLKFNGGAEHLITHDSGLSSALLDAVKSPFLHFDSVSQEVVSTQSVGSRKSPFPPKWTEPKFPSSEFLRRKPIASTGILPSSQSTMGDGFPSPLPSSPTLAQPEPKNVVFMTEMKGTHPNYFGSTPELGLNRKIMPAEKMSGHVSSVQATVPMSNGLCLPLTPSNSINLTVVNEVNDAMTQPRLEFIPLIPKSVEDSHVMISVDDDDEEEINLMDIGNTSIQTKSKAEPENLNSLQNSDMRLHENTIPTGVRFIENHVMMRSAPRSTENVSAIRILPGTSNQALATDLSACNQVRLVPSPSPVISLAASGAPMEVQLLEQNFTLAPPNPSPIRLVPTLVSPQISAFHSSSFDAKQLKSDETHGGKSVTTQEGIVSMSEDGPICGGIPKRMPGMMSATPMESLESRAALTVHGTSDFVQPVSCFKCADCGFLGMTEKEVESHAVSVHGIEVGSPDDWLAMAQSEGIKLECPFCPNTFNAEGSRSFKVHVIDDHGVNDGDAEQHFVECQEKRRKKTLETMRKKRDLEKEERKRAKRDTLEAYVNSKGELRVRNVRRARKGSDKRTHVFTRINEDVDVTAEEYVDAIKIGKNLNKTRKKGAPDGPSSSILPNEKQKILIGLSINSKKQDASSESEEDLDSDDEDLDIDIETLAPVPNEGNGQTCEMDVERKKRRVGRPKGSRSLGLTKLKRLNRNIELSDEHMGSECGLLGCVVRLKDEEKLDYHRKCHSAQTGDPKQSTLLCPECQTEHSDWQHMSMHLWNKHRIDMELFSCDVCNSYKSYSFARVQMHKICHKVAKPFLCDDCGKGFKKNRNLKLHVEVHRRRLLPERDAAKLECTHCSQLFREPRRLKHHIETVHQKLRPHLCNFCGYSASSKSSLRLHLRLHTGEKPYSCPECSYRSNDHNALRRHKLRHSGVKPYKCHYCSYSSIQSSTYVVHLRNKHPKESESHLFSCQKCQFKTLKKSNYLAHVANHKETNVKDSRSMSDESKIGQEKGAIVGPDNDQSVRKTKVNAANVNASKNIEGSQDTNAMPEDR